MINKKNNANDNLIVPQMPTLLRQIVMSLKTKYPNVTLKVLTNIVLAKIAQMITSKRVKYNLIEDILYPNHYAIIFMPSGYGKDLISKALDDHIFKNFRIWFKETEEKYYQTRVNQITYKADVEFSSDKQKKQRLKYIEEECKKIRCLPIEISKGTPEGLFADSFAFQKAGFGALMIKYGEFGLLLKNAKNEDNKLMQALLELFDGRLSAKSIKMDNNIYEVNNIPCNTLLYSDPTLFAKDLKPMFNTLMQTGLGRRATISYLPQQKTLIEKNPDPEQQKEMLQYMNKCNNDLLNSFDLLNKLEAVRGIHKNTVSDCGIGFDKIRNCFVIPSFEYSITDSYIIGHEYRPADFSKKILRSTGTPLNMCMINSYTPLTEVLAIVEGYMDGYALYQYLKELNQIQYYHIVTPCNGVGSLIKQISIINFDKYKTCYLYIDNDNAGNDIAAKLLELYPFMKRVNMTCGCKDFNEHYLKCIKNII